MSEAVSEALVLMNFGVFFSSPFESETIPGSVKRVTLKQLVTFMPTIPSDGYCLSAVHSVTCDKIFRL